MKYETIICFETHVELNTTTKLFCDCAVKVDSPPNHQICPVCTGQPGALPVLNKTAVEYSVRAGLALNCSINRHSRFARKNYFYPDLPKGYQISQFELPFCENGYLEIQDDNGRPYQVGIKRIHLEEDAGKLVHSSSSFDTADYSLVDYNRSSVPLLEIVGDHEQNPLRSIQQARAYLEKIRQVLRYIEVSECRIEKGQFRCDVNISLRPHGAKEFGNRTEIKNMSSFKFITEALEYEIKRQRKLLQSGQQVKQETRLFDEQKKITRPMRSKEDAPDYRYFPDPDLIDVELDQAFIDSIKQSLPVLPDQKKKNFINEFGISANDAQILTKDKHVADYFSACAVLCADRQKLSRWIIKEFFKLLNESGVSILESRISPDNFTRFITLLSNDEITDSIGREVLTEMFSSGKSPQKIIQEKDLKPIQDDDLLSELLNDLFAKNEKIVNQIREGEVKLIDFLIGQVMRATRGKANPKRVKELIVRQLETGSSNHSQDD